MTTSRARALAIALVWLAPACKDGGGDPVGSLCAQYFSCDCSVPVYADEAACEADVQAQFDGYEQTAAANGLTFDRACLDEAVRLYREVIECRSIVDFLSDGFGDGYDICDLCQIVHGSAGVGEACTEVDGGSDCAADLICSNGACLSPCSQAPEGATCYSEESGTVSGCGPGLYCDVGQSNTCKKEVGAGQPCVTGGECADGLYCDGVDSTCKPEPTLGQPCTFTCADELVCTDGTCQTPPEKGQPCDFTCAGDLLCDNGVCVDPPGEGQPCEFSCAEGLFCENDVCVVPEPLICDGFSDEDDAMMSP